MTMRGKKLLIILAVALVAPGIAACKAKTPLTSPAKDTVAVAGGGKTVGKPLVGGKVTIQASTIGPATDLVAWMFGPLETSKGSELGSASTVDASGNYSFQNLQAGTYHLQFGHTWSSPNTAVLADGTSVRKLDYPLKITPNNQGGKDALASDDSTTVTIQSTSVSLPAVVITQDALASTWTPTDFVPKDGQKLPTRAFLEFNLTKPTGGRELTVIVKEGDTQVYKDQTVSGHLVWHAAYAGSFRYQVTATLVSSKTLTSPWYAFTVGP